MNILHETLCNTISNLPREFISNLLADKLASQGICMSNRKLSQLVEHVITNSTNTFILNEHSVECDHNRIVSITKEDIDGILDKYNTFKSAFPESLQLIIEDLSKIILEELYNNWAAEYERQKQEQFTFEMRLSDHWSSGIERFKMLITISRELGDSINTQLRNDVVNTPALIDVLTRLHARACQVAEEIACLMSSGFADGAMARWRTLHEIAAVALLISIYGEDTAQRYVDHQAVETYKAAIKYQSLAKRLDYKTFTKKEMEEITKDRNEMVSKYGNSFKSDYGWASNVLNNNNPKFCHIEEAACIDHLRAHYKMASHNVHANPKGIYFNHGLLDESKMLLSGPSDVGFTDPGHCAAISLIQATTALGLISCNLDTLVVLNIINALQADIGETLLSAEINYTQER